MTGQSTTWTCACGQLRIRTDTPIREAVILFERHGRDACWDAGEPIRCARPQDN